MAGENENRAQHLADPPSAMEAIRQAEQLQLSEGDISTNNQIPLSDQSAEDTCEKCMCKIEVGNYPVAQIARHTFILYTRTKQDGTVIRTFYRFGSTYNSLYPDEGSGNGYFNIINHNPDGIKREEAYDPDTGELNPPPKRFENDPNWKNRIERNLFKALKGTWGYFDGSQEEEAWKEHKSNLVLIAEGSDYCHFHNKFIATMKDIIHEGYYYNIDFNGANCNSGTYTMLVRDGLTPKHPSDGLYPGWRIDLLTFRKDEHHGNE